MRWINLCLNEFSLSLRLLTVWKFAGDFTGVATVSIECVVDHPGPVNFIVDVLERVRDRSHGSLAMLIVASCHHC
jgi:hypothetical protein